MVSRETSEPVDVPAAPDGLLECYPDAVDRLIQYAGILAADGVTRGLIGPREVSRLWDRHLLNCAVIEELIPPGVTVADIGSGAGLPGIVLALVRPDLRITLIEAMLRRSTFLSEAVESLGLKNVVVVRGRAEELPRTSRFDVVTSRAVAPLPKLAAWCAPILASQGRMLAMKGESADSELIESRGALKKLKLDAGRILRVGDGLVDPPTTVVEIRGPMRANPSKKRSVKSKASNKSKATKSTKAPPTERRTR